MSFANEVDETNILPLSISQFKNISRSEIPKIELLRH